MPLLTALSVGATLVLALFCAALAARSARQRPGSGALLALLGAGALLTARAAARGVGWDETPGETAAALGLFTALPPLAALYARGALGGRALSLHDARHAFAPLAAFSTVAVLLGRGAMTLAAWQAYAVALQALALGYGVWIVRLWRASERPRWAGGVLAAFGVHWALSAGAWAGGLVEAVPLAWALALEGLSMAALVGFGGLAVVGALRRVPALAPPAPAPYALSGTPEAERQRLARRLRDAFERDRLHLDPDLSAGALAEAIGATPRELSEVLTRELGQSFFEAVAARRVEEAKARLADPAQADATVLEILHASGFNSKSAFHRAFREHAGQTPSAYRRAALAGRRQAA